MHCFSRHAAALVFVGLLLGKCGGSSPPTPPGTVPPAIFSPTANTTLGGAQSFDSVSVPAGVTVTVSADLALTVSGDVNIAGSLAGDCVAVAITAGGALRATGNLKNSCSNVHNSPKCPRRWTVLQGVA